MTAQIVGSLPAAGAVPVIARAGRTHAARQDARSTKRSLRRTRRTARAHTVRSAIDAIILPLGLATAAFGIAR